MDHLLTIMVLPALATERRAPKAEGETVSHALVSASSNGAFSYKASLATVHRSALRPTRYPLLPIPPYPCRWLQPDPAVPNQESEKWPSTSFSARKTRSKAT